jgi:hypothetical protein
LRYLADQPTPHGLTPDGKAFVRNLCESLKTVAALGRLQKSASSLKVNLENLEGM